MISVRGWCGLIACVVSAGEAQAVYYAGIAVRDITPCTPGMTCTTDGIAVSENDRQAPLSLMYGSGGNAQPLEAGTLPLSVRALALRDEDGRRFVIITLDTVDVTATFTRDVRYELGIRRQLWPSQILINASHTHNSPSLGWFHGLSTTQFKEHPSVTRYVEGVKLRAILAAEEALSNMAPVTLRFIRGTTDIATWRRQTDPRQPFATRAPAPLDVLIAERLVAGTWTRAVLFSTGCHSTGMYGDDHLSPDFAGHARTEVEAAVPGTTAFFVQGFAGDKEPYLNEVDGYDAFSRTVDTGLRLGSQVVGLVNSPANILSGPLRSKARTFSLAIDPSGVTRANYGTQALQVEAQMLQIGDDPSLSSSWALLASSHEVVSEYEALVRPALSAYSQLTLAGFSNAVESYIPTRRMIDYDHAAGAPACGFLYSRRYEGCGAFHSYYLGRPSWQDSDYLNGLIALADGPFPTAAEPLVFTEQDNFDDNLRNDQLWNTYMMTNLPVDVLTYDSAVRVSERGGVLELMPLANTGGLRYNGYVFNRPYNFTGRRATIEVVQTTNSAATSEMIFSVSANGTNHYRWVIQNGWLRADETLDSESPSQPRTSNSWVWVLAYHPVNHRYLRIRHDAVSDRIFWEVSADRVSWNSLRNAPRRFPVQSIRVELYAGTYGPVAAPGVAKFDNFSLE